MIATTAAELATLFRQDVDDVLLVDDTDRLWKDAEIYRYMTVAADRTARDTECLYKVLQLAVTADEPNVVLPRYVHNIRGAKLLTAERVVQPLNANEAQPFDRTPFDIGFLAPSAITWTRDYERGALVLSPTPTIDDTLELQCSITIAVPLTEGAMLPFRDIEEQQLMLRWMKAQAYRKHDAETLDLKRAQQYEAEYRDYAHERKYELLRRRRQPGVVRMAGW